MKHSLSVVCLSLLLFHTHFSLAKRGGGSFGKGLGAKKTHTSNRGSTNTKSNAGNKNNKGSGSQAGYPQQPVQPNQAGRPGYPAGYPQQPGYPARGSPYGGGYGSQGGQGGYGGRGGYGGQGGYGGGYMNQNPNNKVLSPQYGGSYGYGGHGTGRGSPFSNSVQQMGMYPNDRSRGFGRSAVMAAAGGAMVGMALGYGLGRFPRPPFSFHNPQEEHYYNHYMHRRYGTQSTDNNDYSRDYRYSKPPETFDGYMDRCMKRTNLLSAEDPKPNNKPAITTAGVTSARDTGTGSITTETNSTAADNSSTSAPATRPLNQPTANPAPPASQVGSSAEDDDTVSITEIGYPALIEQMKARRCLEMYMDYSDKYLKRLNDGVQRLEMGLRGLLAVVTSTTLMLTLLH